MKYAVYNTLGDIQWTGDCPPALVTKQGFQNKGHKSCEVAPGVSELTHWINPNTGKANKLAVAKQRARQQALDDLANVKPGKSKIEKVLSYLKSKGVDLGPDGKDL